MGKEQWWCGHPGIEEEGWKRVEERDGRSLGIASVNRFAFSPDVLASEALSLRWEESGCEYLRA